MLDSIFNAKTATTFGVTFNERCCGDVFLIATLALAEPNILARFIFADRTDCGEAREYYVG